MEKKYIKYNSSPVDNKSHYGNNTNNIYIHKNKSNIFYPNNYMHNSLNLNNSNNNKDVYSNNNNRNTSNKINITSIWNNFVAMFQNSEIPKIERREINSPQPRDNIPEQYCSCKKTHNRDYCDSIYEIIQMTKNAKFDTKRSKELYKSLVKVNDKILDMNGDNITQIKKDLNRTYPSISMFKKEKILVKLKNVLRAFSNYDTRIKYIQGMNFIVGFFLYHCEEYVAFWLFVSLIEEYDLRNIFMDGFPGLKTHVKVVENILRKKYKYIWNVFQKIGVKVEIFMIEWVFSLFSSLIPLDLQIEFYKGFFSESWMFFYKMCISSILNVKGIFYHADEIYIALKCGKNEDNVKEEDIKNKWKKIIQEAYKLKLEIGDVS